MAPVAVRPAALAPAHDLARVPRIGARRRGRGLGFDLDLGPPARHPGPVAAADLRGLGAAHRGRRDHEARPVGLMVGANTFRNPGVTTKLATTLDHVSERPRDPRHRRRLVRARARGLRHRLRGERRRAPRQARGGRAADAPAVRRRAGHATRAASTRSSTRCASRARSRPTCRSSSAAAARRRRSARSRATPTAGTRAATSRP